MYNKFKNRRKPPVKKSELLKFQPLAKRINHYLKDDNIDLSFLGYTDTLNRYFRLSDNDIIEAFELMTETNLWSQYFSDLEGIIQIKFSEIEIKRDMLKAMQDKKNPDEKLDKKIKELSQKHRYFKIFIKQINTQKKFFDKAFYHCLKVYNSGMNSLNYKSFY